MRSLNLSTSKITCFKQCRKKYFFKYVERIEFPETEELKIGQNYHKNVANILSKKEYNITPMSNAFKNFILPSLPEIKNIELEFNIPLSYGTKLHGYIDAITTENIPIEHKTTKNTIDEKYIYRLNFDEQTTTYLLALSLINKTVSLKMIYTSIQKITIRQKQNETEEEYKQRCFNWYNESKARVFNVVRSENELQAWQNELIQLSSEIKKCKNFYRNPSACMFLSCPYESICQDFTREIY